MPLEHAILGFLDYQPMTGYDLKKYFDQSIAHFWSVTQSHIYKALDALEAKGLAKSTMVMQEGAPNRKEYTITAQGQAELRHWLATPLPLKAVREDWLIQIFFSHFSTNDEIAALLESRAESIRSHLVTFRQNAQAAINENARRIGMERPRELWQITLDYGVSFYEHELAWLEDTIARVRTLPPLMPPSNQ